ncbi:MAG: hypothetical protein EHJ95_05140 [Methanobacteriota archaeon]|nr:MAG: hypothetical protein EHJ95_05140 [Euryarchaeota archaeon]
MSGAAVFSEDAIKKIAITAQGIPRTINILCDNALVTAYGYQKKPVSARIVGEIIRDIDRRNSTAPLKWKYAPVFAAALVAAVFWIYGRDFDRAAVVSSPPLKPVEIAVAEKPLAPSGYVRQTIQGAAQALPNKPEKTALIDGAGESIVPPSAKKQAVPPHTQKDGHAATRNAVRTIKKGDTLTRLIIDQYGYVDDRLITLVRDRNPWIKNANKIYTGFKLVLPEMDKSKNKKER